MILNKYGKWLDSNLSLITNQKRVLNNVTRQILFFLKKINLLILFQFYIFQIYEFTMSSIIELSDIKEYNAEDFTDVAGIVNKDKVNNV